MQRLESIPLRLALAVSTAAGTWWAVVWILELLRSPHPLLFANILMISLIVHETGHLIAFKRHGITSCMFFLVILGGVMPLDFKKPTSSQMPRKPKWRSQVSWATRW